MSSAAAASVNHWPESKCAEAFWGQQELPAYRKLLADTADWLDPQPRERWLDLGCGCGQLSRAVWERSQGRVGEIVSLDCAAANEPALQQLAATVFPSPAPGQMRFVHADFSAGLNSWSAGTFDGVVSGLAIQYAECFSAAEGRWTTAAYDRLLADVCRVLKPGGRFVFSVNVPEPAWGKVALRSLRGVFQSPRPGRYLKNALRMWRYGSWLTQEARRGRFHYLPVETILAKLTAAGFTALEHRRTYAGQAYLLRCRKPAAS